MHTRRFKAPLPLPWVNGCDSSRGMSNAFTNTKPVSPHRSWYTDNLNVCSPLIIPFTTSLYWIIHLHTSDWDQQQKGLVCGCTSFSLRWSLITSVSREGTKHELEVEWGFLSTWRLKITGGGKCLLELRNTTEHISIMCMWFHSYLTTWHFRQSFQHCIWTVNNTESIIKF